MPELIRPASWAEVDTQFHGCQNDALANAAGWARRFGLGVQDFRRARVVLESWTHQEIAEAMVAMAVHEPRMLVDMVDGVNNAVAPPRLDGLPVTVVRFGGRVGMIDGKHRANRWKKVPGRYAVLVIQC